MEAPTTLADSLLDDLDDLSDVDQDEAEYPRVQTGKKEERGFCNEQNGISDGMNGITNDLMAAGTDAPSNGDCTATVFRENLTLLGEPRLHRHMEKIRFLSIPGDGKSGNVDGFTGDKLDLSEYYDLIVTSNKHLSSLSEEHSRAHSELCRAYHPKFPELEELVVDPTQYRNAVQVLGNEMDVTRKNDELNDILTSNQIITISVAGSTTSGRPLTKTEMDRVEAAGTYMDRVAEVRSELTSFVESKMGELAPNVCAIVGPTVAARLVGLAGGLAELSKIPACNLQVMGQVRQNASSRGGMSSLHSRPHAGIIYDSDLVRMCPSHMKRKVAKAVSAKVALAARCDFVNSERGIRSPNGEAGNKFLQEIKAKMVKWDEPDKAPVVKALPKPDLTTKKRRGGKRIRRMKERFEETELMKQANKRAFFKETGEYGDDAMGKTLGLLDAKDGVGWDVRRTAEKKKMRQANTKASRKRAIQLSSGSTNGLASSMVFTPVQGLELVNPNANRDRVREANMKWFSENAGFQSALPKDT